MKQVICSNLKCKHWKQSGICNCKTIILKFSNIAIVNQGRKDILECSRYEETIFDTVGRRGDRVVWLDAQGRHLWR